MARSTKRRFLIGSAIGAVLAGSPARAQPAGQALTVRPLSDWLADDPVLPEGEIAIARRPDAAPIVKVGMGETWRATPAISDPYSLDSVSDLARTDWLSAGDLVRVAGRRAPGDGGHATWILSTGIEPDGYCRIATKSGLTAHLLPEPTTDIRAAGIFADTRGDLTSRALLSLVHRMIEAGGGTILVAERIVCTNTVFPPVPHGAAITVEMLPSAHVRPSNPDPDVFLWDFPAGPKGKTSVHFRNVTVWGGRDRPAANGIRIGPTNRMVIDNCSAHWLAGCGWRIEGAFNARIDLTTVHCGTPDGTYAQNFVTHAETGKVCNDIVLSGTTEQDSHGINLEGGVILRTGSSLKLHGGPETLRALRVHCCASFDLRVIASQDWNGDGFILVSDAKNGIGETLRAPAPEVPRVTRGTLAIDTMYNIRWSGTGHGDWCLVDLQTPGSYLALSGLLGAQRDPQHAGAPYSHLAIQGPGKPGVTIGLDGLRFAADVHPGLRMRDARDPASGRPGHPQPAEPATRVLTRDDMTRGGFDLRGARFVDISLEDELTIETLLMEDGQSCTLCAPNGGLTLMHSEALRLSGSRPVTFSPHAVLTLVCAGPGRIYEISRCTP